MWSRGWTCSPSTHYWVEPMGWAVQGRDVGVRPRGRPLRRRLGWRWLGVMIGHGRISAAGATVGGVAVRGGVRGAVVDGRRKARGGCVDMRRGVHVRGMGRGVFVRGVRCVG